MIPRESRLHSDKRMVSTVSQLNLPTHFNVTNQVNSFAVGHLLTAINGVLVNGSTTEEGKDVKELIENPENYPLTLKFSRPKMTTNEKIFLASMFYPLFAIASQLSPVPKSSGIEVLEADTFKLHCFQTLTGG